MSEVIEGSCYCGELRYQLAAPLGLIANCHCPFCRRIHGAPFTTVSFIAVDALEWTAGAPNVFETPMGSRRNFCPRCATPVCNFPAAGDFASLVMGSVDEAFQQEAWMHVSIESKLPWTRLDDGLPAFEGFPSHSQIAELVRARRNGGT